MATECLREIGANLVIMGRMRILVTWRRRASCVVIVPKAVSEGHDVVGLVTRPRCVRPRRHGPARRSIHPRRITAALGWRRVAYYLIHSMGARSGDALDICRARPPRPPRPSPPRRASRVFAGSSTSAGYRASHSRRHLAAARGRGILPRRSRTRFRACERDRDRCTDRASFRMTGSARRRGCECFALAGWRRDRTLPMTSAA